MPTGDGRAGRRERRVQVEHRLRLDRDERQAHRVGAVDGDDLLGGSRPERGHHAGADEDAARLQPDDVQRALVLGGVHDGRRVGGRDLEAGASNRQAAPQRIHAADRERERAADGIVGGSGTTVEVSRRKPTY